MPAQSPGSTMVRILAGVLGRIVLIALGTGLALLAWFFPYDTDAPKSADEMAKEQEYYGKAFAQSDRQLNPVESAESAEEERYVKIGEVVAEAYHIEEKLQTFITKYGLARKKALDVGSGRGYLQDVVENYTGLDISPTAARFYHKRFVLGSATSMPFEADSFDVVWSIDVLEHVPNPEQALTEIRRVAKDGALLYLVPAWDCQPYLADGYNVRPYSDFGVRGKLIKAAIPARVTAHVFSRMMIYPVRFASWKGSGEPTRLHYHRLEPNYKTYWGPDADAVNSLDRYETTLWFRSRGDECLNCETGLDALAQDDTRLIIRVHKDGIYKSRT
jgi:SAM-dependent methyltransferase